MKKPELQAMGDMTTFVYHRSHDQLKDFPYKARLSLLPIIDFWNTRAEQGDKFQAAYARSILKKLEKAPELSKPIDDLKIVEKHRKLVNQLMSAVFPRALRLNEIKAAGIPFMMDHFISTPRFDQLTQSDGLFTSNHGKFGEISTNFIRFFYCCTIILKKFYNIDVNFEIPLIFKFPDNETGLDQYFKMVGNADFTDFIAVEPLKKLTSKDISQLVNNFHDVDLWMKYIPPQNFMIEGLVITTLVNVTIHEVLSRLKNDLLEKDSIVASNRFESIQRNIQNIYQLPHLRVGLAAFSQNGESISNFGRHVWSHLNCKASIENSERQFKGSIYHQLAVTKRPVVIDDLENYPSATAFEKALFTHGIKNILVAPLIYDDELIGFLEIGSPVKGDLTAVSITRLNEILPLFAIALKRSLDERENRIEALIKEKCTAIHPSVEWRFNQAAHNLLLKMDNGEEADLEPIVFP